MNLFYYQVNEFAKFRSVEKWFSKLRNKGVLTFRIGNIIHNLPLVDWQNIDTVGSAWDWALEAREKTNLWILNGDFAKILNYHKQGIAVQ